MTDHRLAENRRHRLAGETATAHAGGDKRKYVHENSVQLRLFAGAGLQ
jgi:hypothetical protein